MLKKLMDILRRQELTAIMEVAERIVDLIQKKGTAGRAADLIPLMDDMGYINLIPSNAVGECRAPLVVLCYDRDSFHERLREMLYCAGITCAPITKEVCFFTSKFDANVFELHRRSVEALRARGTKITFLLISSQTVSSVGT